MSEDMKTQVRKMVKDMTVSQVAKKLGITTQRIYVLCRNEGIEFKRAQPLPRTKREILRDVAAMGSVQAVADKYGVSRQAVYYRIQP